MIEHQITNSYGNYNNNAFIYQNRGYHPHFHGNYELIYALHGNITISINGVFDTLFQGEMILVSPYTVHSLKAEGESLMWVGVFSQDFISAFAEKNKNISYSKFRCDKDAEDILKKYLFTEKRPEHFLHISCLYLVCSECIKNAHPADSRGDNDFRYKVTDHISKNISVEPSMLRTAELLGYEYHYFSSLFNNCFGMNFKAFVNLFRFEKACRLLSDKNCDITNVCCECGFGSIRNFNRVFKSFSGITPGEYRKKQ